MRSLHHHSRLLLGLFACSFCLYTCSISSFLFPVLLCFFVWLHYSATHRATVYFRIQDQQFCVDTASRFYSHLRTKSAPCGQSHGWALGPRVSSLDDDKDFPTLSWQLAVPGVSEWWVCLGIDYWPFTFKTYFSYWSGASYRLWSHVCFPFCQAPRP